MKKILNSHVILLTFLIAVVYPASFAQAFSAKDQEVITTKDSRGQTVSLIVPRHAIDPSQIAVLANLQDVQSVNTAQYYSQVRNIPSQNTIYLSFPPARTKIRATEFNQLKKQVDAAVALLPDIQAYVITWTEPWGVLKDTGNEGMSINAAFALGFDEYFSVQQMGCFPDKVDTYNVSSNRPYSDYKVRPAMMLAGTNFTNVKDLIDRGKRSDGTFPGGQGYFIRTTDATRSGVRYQDFIDTVNFWNRPDGIAMSYIDNSAGTGVNYLMNKTDVLFYFTGLTTVPQINTNAYVPGAMADHLTSYGGILTGTSSQMSSLRWLEAGATGSYGTMLEPYAVSERFPDAGVATQHYFGGETLLESYWKSVAKPDLGVFIGDPLARPYGTKMTVDGAGQLNIKTSILDPNRVYSLWSADNINGPFTLVKQGITLTKPSLQNIQTPATRSVYLLQEDVPSFDPNVPFALTKDAATEMHVAIDGDQLAWSIVSRGQSTIFLKNIKTGITKQIPMAVQIVNDLKLNSNMLAFKSTDCKSKMELVGLLNITTGQNVNIIGTAPLGSLGSLVFNNNRVFWVDTRTGISMYNLATSTTTLVHANPNIRQFDVDGNIIALKDVSIYPAVIKIVDSLKNTQIQLVSEGDPQEVRVKGNKVYWSYADSFGSGALVSYDNVTKQKQKLLNISSAFDKTFEVSDKWAAIRDTKAGEGNPSFYAYNMDSRSTQKIDIGKAFLKPIKRYYPETYSFALSDDRFVWVATSKIDYFDDVYIKSFVPDLVAHWEMEDKGIVANDSTLNNNNAKFVNAPTWSTGKDLGGLSFDGIDDYLKVDNKSVLELGKNNTDFSVAFWMKLKSAATGANRSLMRKDTNTTPSTPLMGMFPSDNRLNFCVHTTDAQPDKCATSMDAIVPSTWAHVAYVKSGIKLQVFINGDLNAALAFTGNIVSSNAPLILGKANVIMDDVRIYRRALSAGEIQALIESKGGLVPYIVTQPRNKVASPGTTVSFNVVANGSEPFTYQWKKNGIVIQNATASSYTTGLINILDNGVKYSAVVTNAHGSVVSDNAVLTVQDSMPSIVIQPTNQTVYVGQNVLLSVVVSNTSGLTYQWQKNGIDILGATGNVYSAATTLADNSAKYSVKVSNLYGSTVSVPATLIVKDIDIQISKQPTSQIGMVGKSASFSVVARGPSTLTYQWKKNGLSIPGATASTYVTPSLTMQDNNAKYNVVVSSGSRSVTSITALLAVNSNSLSILRQPVSQTVSVGQRATFDIVSNLKSQDFAIMMWMKNGKFIITPDARTSIYTTPPVTAQDNGAKYSIIIVSMHGVVMSSSAVLTVK